MEFAEIPPDGIHLNIPAETYHRMDCANRGAVAAVAEGAPLARVRYDFLHPERPTPDMEFGTAFHVALLEPSRFVQDYASLPETMPDRRTKEGKAQWLVESLKHGSRRLLEFDDFRKIQSMVESVKAHPGLQALMEDMNKLIEPTVIWEDGDTGLKCRARPDVYCPAFEACLDFKTTADASKPEYAVFRWGYHYQAAFYARGLAICGKPCANFAFVFVEKQPPYLVRAVELSAEAVTIAVREMIPAMRQLAEAYRTGIWPGYPNEITPVSLPAWKLKQVKGEHYERVEI